MHVWWGHQSRILLTHTILFNSLLMAVFLIHLRLGITLCYILACWDHQSSATSTVDQSASLHYTLFVNCIPFIVHRRAHNKYSMLDFLTGLRHGLSCTMQNYIQLSSTLLYVDGYMYIIPVSVLNIPNPKCFYWDPPPDWLKKEWTLNGYHRHSWVHVPNTPSIERGS